MATLGAYVLWPVFNYLVIHCRWHRGFAAWVLTGSLIAIIVFFGMLCWPVLWHQWEIVQAQLRLPSQWPQALSQIVSIDMPLLWSWLGQHGLDLPQTWVAFLDPAQISLWLMQSVWANRHGLGAWGSALWHVLFALLLTPLCLAYGLKDGIPAWQRWKTQEVTAKIPGLNRFVQAMNEVVWHYFRGQLMVVLILLIYYVTTLTLWGLPSALWVGSVTAVGVLLPYVGFIFGLVCALSLGLLKWSVIHTLWVVGSVYGVGQMLEGFFLTPHWVGRRLGVHPLILILALIVLGAWGGILGLMLAAPLCGLVTHMVRHASDNSDKTALNPTPTHHSKKSA
jgi:predicted PurR-regulated permease PerM